MTTDSELGIVSANFVRTFIGRQSISVYSLTYRQPAIDTLMA